MRLLVGEIFNFSDLREREPFPEAPVYEVLPFRTEPMVVAYTGASFVLAIMRIITPQ
jgi:hypothetical protein